MGVIHKLKDEVIAYILEQKKDNPSIGVRKLSDLTSDKFQIKVSKSSVSTILKNALLSSAVGRRPGGAAKPSKFAIPSNRKTEISKNMEKAGYAKQPAKHDEEQIEKAPESVNKASANDESMSLMPDLLAEQASHKEPEIIETKQERVADDDRFLKQVERLREQKSKRGVSSLKGMGYVFLKAAQWEIFDKSLIAELFKKHMSGSNQETFAAACEIYLYLRFLGVESFDRVLDYQEHGLWQLNKLKGRSLDESEILLKIKDLFLWGAGVKDELAVSIVVEYGLEKLYAYTEVCGFELFIEDGSKMVLDAALSKIGYGDKIPINKAMTWLSNYIISNIGCPAFFVAPGDDKIDSAFFDIVSIFENFSGRGIQKATVIDKNKKEIAEFTTIPSQRRNFMIGIAPWQREFEQLTKNAKWAGKKPYYHEETDRIVFYGETKTDFLSQQFKREMDNFRVIALWNNKEENPAWAILTNIEKEESEDIASAYISRWPNFGLRPNGAGSLGDSGSAGDKTDLKIRVITHYRIVSFQVVGFVLNGSPKFRSLIFEILSSITNSCLQCALRVCLHGNNTSDDQRNKNRILSGILSSFIFNQFS